MKNDIDIKSLWDNQQISVPDISSIHKQIKLFKLRNIREAVTVIILMITVIASGLALEFYCAPQLITTDIGIIILTIGFILPILSYSRSLYLYRRLKEDISTAGYINNLLSIKKQETRRHRTILNLYFLLLSLGFFLYSYEYTFCNSFIIGMISYIALLTWIAVNWFILRPYIIKKRNRHFADFMEYLETNKKRLCDTETVDR